MAIFSVGDVVKIKDAWCDYPTEGLRRWVVVEVFDYSGTQMKDRFNISLLMTEEEKRAHPFGRIETVEADMIEMGVSE